MRSQLYVQGPSGLFLPFFFGFFLLSFLFSACVVNGPAYAPAYGGNTGKYLAKPVYTDSTTTRLYLSGRYNQGYTFYAGEKNETFDMTFHIARMYKNIYWAGGGYLFNGHYTKNTEGRKSVNGRGLVVESGARVPLGSKFDMLIGINAEIYGESGTFINSIDNLHNHFGLRTGPQLEFRLIANDKFNCGIRYHLDAYQVPRRIRYDVVLNSNLIQTRLRNLDRVTLQASYKNVTLFNQWGFPRYGKPIVNLGLTYRLPSFD